MRLSVGAGAAALLRESATMAITPPRKVLNFCMVQVDLDGQCIVKKMRIVPVVHKFHKTTSLAKLTNHVCPRLQHRRTTPVVCNNHPYSAPDVQQYLVEVARFKRA